MAKSMPPNMSASASVNEPTRFAGPSQGEEETRKRAKLKKIRVGLLRANPHQPEHRHTSEAVETLVESIREQGLLQPPLARRLTDGTYRLLAGHRRSVAWRQLAFEGVLEERIPVWVVEDMTDAEEIYAIAAEYSHRREYDMVHTATVIGRAWEKRAMELGRDPTSAEVADVVPWSSSSVAAYRKVHMALGDDDLRPLIQSLDEPDISLVYKALCASEFRTRKAALEAYRCNGPAAAKKVLRPAAKAGRPLKVVTRRKARGGQNVTFRVWPDRGPEWDVRLLSEAEALVEELRERVERAADPEAA